MLPHTKQVVGEEGATQRHQERKYVTCKARRQPKGCSREPCPRRQKEKKGMPTHTQVTHAHPLTPHIQGTKGMPVPASRSKHNTTASATDTQHGMKGQEG